MAGSAGKRSRMDDETYLNAESTSLILDELRETVLEINRKLDELPRITSEIREIKLTINMIKDDVCVNRNNITENTKNIAQVDKKVISMQNQLDFLHNQARSMNVVFSNVPKTNKMSDENIVKNIGNVLGINLDDKILKVYRIPNGNSNQPQPLVASFVNNSIKDGIISKYINIRSNQQEVTHKQVNISDLNKPIYISEHLTKKSNYLQMLVRRARRIEPNLFTSLFTRNGRVGIKKKGETQYTFLNSPDELFRLCMESTIIQLQKHENKKHQENKNNSDESEIVLSSAPRSSDQQSKSSIQQLMQNSPSHDSSN